MVQEITYILVETQLPENLGAVCRAMWNFGKTDLRLVNPRSGVVGEKAYEMAVKGAFILDKAEIYSDLASAVSDLNYLYATTARDRYMQKPSISTKDLKLDIDSLPSESKIGIIFGPERSGLINDDVAIADKILYIDANPAYSSLNIAQSAVIISYELSQLTMRNDFDYDYILASSADLNHMMKHLESGLDASNFFQVAEKKPQMMRNIINIFKRINNLSKQDIQTLHGIVVALQNNAEQNNERR